MTSNADSEVATAHINSSSVARAHVDPSTISTENQDVLKTMAMSPASSTNATTQPIPTPPSTAELPPITKSETQRTVSPDTNSQPSGEVDATSSDRNETSALPQVDASVSQNGSSSNRPRTETDTSASVESAVPAAPTVTIDTAAASPEPGNDGTKSAAADMGFDEFITSPHGNNAIAEKSPGGRYVRFMEKLGSGASKDVYRAYDTQEGIEVAWNVVHLAGVPKNERNRIVNEVRLLERLHHHNIISFHGSWVNRERQQVNFVTEILSSGTLKSFIDKVQVIRWKIAKRWAVQILKGLEYLHAQDPPVIHRDLKCENIFINGTSGDLRIGDLGLSTVHRNGKVLSVLGTPEFMAPDMYEENAYDEKVDIYAFGMCLLEIFTKEIPYGECSNPAQIYKKVTRGDPPDSLKRLKSKHAREFIELCLGQKGDGDDYVRPSAVELLAHPFLQLRPSDGDVVEVEPPLQEKAIREIANESSSPNGSRTKSGTVGEGSDTSEKSYEQLRSSGSPRDKSDRSNSLEEDESDRFDEMPDSETNMRRVKVLMGRGQELKEQEQARPEHTREGSDGLESGTTDSAPKTAPATPTQAPPSVNTSLVADSAVSAPPTVPIRSMHYLVAAAVIENDQSVAKPYIDDVLKLVVTLPVDGETQNVQFDFHLVQDDPVQVAKEMVAELGIPEGAVLEISETVSGLARAARIKQDKYVAQTQNNGQGHAVSQSQPMTSQGQRLSTSSDIQQGVGVHQPQQPVNQMMPSASHQSMPEYLSQQQVPQQPHSQHVQQAIHHHQQQQPMHPQQVVQQQGAHPGIHTSQQGPEAGQGQQLPMNQQMPQQHMVHPSQQESTMRAPTYGQQMPLHQQTNHLQAQPPQPSTSFSQQQQQQPMQPLQVSHQQAPGAQSLPTDVHAQPPGQSYSAQHVPQALGPGGPANGGTVAGHYPNHSQDQSQFSTNPGHAPNHQMQQSQQQHIQVHQNAGMALPQHQQAQPVAGQQYPPNMPQNGHNAQFQQGMPVQQHPIPQPQNQHVVQQPSSAHLAPTVAPVPSAQQQPQLHSHGSTPSIQQVLPQNHGAHHGIPQTPHHLQNGVQSQSNQRPSLVEAPRSGPPPQQPIVSTVAQTNGYHPSEIGSSMIPPQPVAMQPTHSPASSQSPVEAASQVLFNGALGVPTIENNDDLMDDEYLASEVRKLDDDFKKNMARAQKVFDSRMDKMQQSQVQREEQHLKTLEKHEKERVDFEKRMQQEGIEQSRRIEHLQKEWDRKRDAMKQAKLEEAALDAKILGPSPSEESSIAKSHSRNSSDNSSHR